MIVSNREYVKSKYNLRMIKEVSFLSIIDYIMLIYVRLRTWWPTLSPWTLRLTPTSPASALSRNLLVPNSRIQIANQFPGTKLAFTPKVYSFGELDTISHISNLFLAILNNPSTYEILNPEDFGLTRYVHFASRLTGWNAVKTRVAQLGLQMTDEQVKEW